MDAPMMNTDRYDEYVRDADAGAVNYLKQVKDKLIENGVSSVEERLIHGNAASSILDLCLEVPDSLVALPPTDDPGWGGGCWAASPTAWCATPVIRSWSFGRRPDQTPNIRAGRSGRNGSQHCPGRL